MRVSCGTSTLSTTTLASARKVEAAVVSLSCGVSVSTTPFGSTSAGTSMSTVISTEPATMMIFTSSRSMPSNAAANALLILRLRKLPS